MFLHALVQSLRRREERHRGLIERLRDAWMEVERLRAELSHLEHEIYELWATDLPVHRKRLLEEVLRVRCREVQREMAGLQAEIQHAGHHIWSGADRRERRSVP